MKMNKEQLLSTEVPQEKDRASRAWDGALSRWREG